MSTRPFDVAKLLLGIDKICGIVYHLGCCFEWFLRRGDILYETFRGNKVQFRRIVNKGMGRSGYTY